jgi:murein L,D-transpeptidase YcbB/YkuD
MGRSVASHSHPGEEPVVLTNSSRSSNPSRRTAIFSLMALALLAGCHRHRKTTSAPNTTQYADNIQAVVAKKDLPGLRWPNYSDYQAAVTAFYEDRNNEIAWTRDLKPTSATTAFIQAFTEAGAKGLDPEDYDASRWPGRLQQLAQIASTKDTSAASASTRSTSTSTSTSRPRSTISPSSSPTTPSMPMTSPNSFARSSPTPTVTAPPKPRLPTT